MVLEVADGLLQSETQRLVRDTAFRRHVDSVVFTSREAMGAVAGIALLRRHGIPVCAVGGVLTASPLATREARGALDVPVLGVEQLADPSVALSLMQTAGSSRSGGPMLQHRSQSDAALPALWVGGRRHHLVILGLAGLAQALVAGLGAHLVVHALSGRTSPHRGLLFAILVAAAAVVGVLRLVERVVSEWLSQDYVHEIRLGLIRRSLQQGATKSLGVTVARTTNDLSSVKTWVAQGVAPLAVDIPLALGACGVLLLLDPVFGVALLAPLTVLLIGLRLLSPVAYERSRAVRRARGRLAAQIADTVLSTTAIRSAGGSGRGAQPCRPTEPVTCRRRRATGPRCRRLARVGRGHGRTLHRQHHRRRRGERAAGRDHGRRGDRGGVPRRADERPGARRGVPSDVPRGATHHRSRGRAPRGGRLCRITITSGGAFT